MREFSKLAFAALLIACGSPALAQGTGTSSIAIEQPYARATPNGAKTGAAYMTIDNKSAAADHLTGVASDIADKVQIHQMKVENGVMQMREVAGGVPIPANGSVALKPGGYHVMLIGLKKPLAAGDSFPLTLTFAKAGTVSVTVPVQAMSDMGATGNGGTMGNMGNMGGMGGMGGMSGSKPGGGMGN